MISNLLIALLITVIGMCLVFGAIALLWAGMVVLVNIAERWKKVIADDRVQADKNPPSKEKDNRKLAAAIGAAYALAQSKQSTVHEFPLPPTAFVSAWQAVMRSKNFSTRRQSR